MKIKETIDWILRFDDDTTHDAVHGPLRTFNDLRNFDDWNFLHVTLRYNDILCIIFDYDLFFLFPIMTSVKEKNDLFFWGGILALSILFFDFLLHVRQHQPWGLADLNKNTIHGVLQAFPLVLSFF